MARDDSTDKASVEPADPSAGAGWAGAVPSLEARTVVGVFEDCDDAEGMYHELIRGGIDAEQLSVVCQSGEVAPQVGAGDTKADTGAAAGATAGAIIGGLAGLAVVAVPGVGPLLAIGPLATALASTVTGGALGGLVGSFVGLGVPDEDAKRYEEAVRSGGVFVSVKTPNTDEAARISRLLEERGAVEIATYQPAL